MFKERERVMREREYRERQRREQLEKELRERDQREKELRWVEWAIIRPGKLGKARGIAVENGS